MIDPQKFYQKKKLIDKKVHLDLSKNVMNYEEMFAYFQKIVQDYVLQQADMINKDKPTAKYKPGDLVYLISLQTSLRKTSSRKFRVIYI